MFVVMHEDELPRLNKDFYPECNRTQVFVDYADAEEYMAEEEDEHLVIVEICLRAKTFVTKMVVIREV
jgi:hypothetical protein